MSEQARIDRLAEGLESALADPRGRLTADPPVDLDVAGLLRIALDLRDLPRPAFKTRLGADLARRAAMTTAATDPTTSRGVQSVIPYLAVRPAVELIEFVTRAFGAQELLRTTGTAGGVAAEGRRGGTRPL